MSLSILREMEELVEFLRSIKALVDEQAADRHLWKIPEDTTAKHLQGQLLKLHHLIRGGTPWSP